MWLVLLVLAVPAAASADPVVDERPTKWLARATPGFGVAWDHEPVCAMEGRMFAGGFSAGYHVAPGLLVGVATTIGFNLLPPDASCDSSPMDQPLAIAFVFGATADWYPVRDLGLHVMAVAGYASIEHEFEMTTRTGHGVGGTIGVGHDWKVWDREHPGIESRIGILLGVTLFRTFTDRAEHAARMLSLHATFGFD
jgi:hypothetical protein